MAFDMGGMFANPMFGTIAKGILYGLIALLGMGIAGVVIWFSVKRKKHNIPCIVFTGRTGGQLKVAFDKGGYFKKRNQWYFSLLKLKTKIAPPPQSQLTVGAGGRNILFLYQKGINDYVPVKPDFNKEEFKFEVADQDTQLWADAQVENMKHKYLQQSWWQQNASYVIFAVVAMMCILLIYIVLQKFDTISAGLSGIAKALKHTADVAGTCVQSVPSA